MSMITRLSFEEQLAAYPGIDKESVAELKAWSLKQLYLPQLQYADLAIFYIKNLCDMEATKSNINNYFLMRHHMREYFVTEKDLQSSELKTIFDSVLIATLPQRTKDEHKVILGRLMDNDPKKYNFESAVKVMNMVIDAGIYEGGPLKKYVFVFDLNGATMDHIHTVSLAGLNNLYDYLRKGSPAIWAGAHYVNTGTENTIFQEFIKSQVAEGDFADSSKVQFHPDIDTLIDAIGMKRSMLPKEMGGNAGPAIELQELQIEKLESLHAFFIDLESKSKLVNPQTIPPILEVFGSDEARK